MQIALYTAIFVWRWRLLLLKTRFLSRPKEDEACLILFWMSLSMLQSSDRMLPRYLKCGTMVSGESATEKDGGVCGGSEDHWQRTSVFDVFTDSPILLYALTAAASVVCSASGVCATRAQSSAYWSSSMHSVWSLVLAWSLLMLKSPQR